MDWLIPTPWGPVQFHFCQHELMAMLYCVPFIGASMAAAVYWVKSKFKKNGGCCSKKAVHKH